MHTTLRLTRLLQQYVSPKTQRDKAIIADCVLAQRVQSVGEGSNQTSQITEPHSLQYECRKFIIESEYSTRRQESRGDWTNGLAACRIAYSARRSRNQKLHIC